VKTLQLLLRGRPVIVSTERVKPSYILNGTDHGSNFKPASLNIPDRSTISHAATVLQ
jgi:hypothetical protein